MTPRWPGNRVCELFGIDHPIIQAGMVYNSGARLAAAAAEAGCLGLLGAGSMRPDLLREQIRATRALTDRPFGVNLPLFYTHAAACLDVALDEGVRIFVTSAGSPQRIVRAAQERGLRQRARGGASRLWRASARRRGATRWCARGSRRGGTTGARS